MTFDPVLLAIFGEVLLVTFVLFMAIRAGRHS
jgi:hypothetical protein